MGFRPHGRGPRWTSQRAWDRDPACRQDDLIIALPPGELFSETNDRSVAILLTYGMARILPPGDAEAREEYLAAPYRAYTPSDPVRPVMIAGDISVYWKPPI
jgi:beta-lactamase superfamily II metal-dependent hydrolase